MPDDKPLDAYVDKMNELWRLRNKRKIACIAAVRVIGRHPELADELAAEKLLIESKWKYNPNA